MQPYAKRYKVLIIDDDPLFRSLLVPLLRTDYLVSVASDGADGFYKAAEYPPDIAIVDIQMPQWDGIKTLKAFRGHASLKHTSVIMLTSDASRETVLSAIKEGANDYVIKTSFSKEELKQKVHRLVTRRERERLGLPRFTNPQTSIAPPKNGAMSKADAKSKATAGVAETVVQVAAHPIEAKPEIRTSTSGPPSHDVAIDAAEVASERYSDEVQNIIDDWE